MFVSVCVRLVCVWCAWCWEYSHNIIWTQKLPDLTILTSPRKLITSFPTNIKQNDDYTQRHDTQRDGGETGDIEDKEDTGEDNYLWLYSSRHKGSWWRFSERAQSLVEDIYQEFLLPSSALDEDRYDDKDHGHENDNDEAEDHYDEEEEDHYDDEDDESDDTDDTDLPVILLPPLPPLPPPLPSLQIVGCTICFDFDKMIQINGVSGASRLLKRISGRELHF